MCKNAHFNEYKQRRRIIPIRLLTLHIERAIISENQQQREMEVRIEITTKEIAERFSKTHRDVLRAVKRLDIDGVSMALFKPYKYTSKQNKRLDAYSMGIDGFCLLTDTWGFSRGESAPVKAEILSEFGHSFVVALSSRSRHEDNFHSMLSDFLCHEYIVREYPIAGRKIDFYIPEYSLAIEYDEEQHFSKSSMEKDKERWEAIQDYARLEFDDPISLIRVDKGHEVKGLARISAWIALNTTNASGMTKYIEGGGLINEMDKTRHRCKHGCNA